MEHVYNILYTWASDFQPVGETKNLWVMHASLRVTIRHTAVDATLWHGTGCRGRRSIVFAKRREISVERLVPAQVLEHPAHSPRDPGNVLEHGACKSLGVSAWASSGDR